MSPRPWPPKRRWAGDWDTRAPASPRPSHCSLEEIPAGPSNALVDGQGGEQVRTRSPATLLICCKCGALQRPYHQTRQGFRIASARDAARTAQEPLRGHLNM